MSETTITMFPHETQSREPWGRTNVKRVGSIDVRMCERVKGKVYGRERREKMS